MIDRRRFLGIAGGASASLVLAPDLLRALQHSCSNCMSIPDGKLIQRAIPSSGELLPAIGLSFSNHPGCSDHAVLKEVLKSFYDNGGRVYDAMHVNPSSEEFHLSAATELGIQDQMFWSTRGTPGDAAPQPGAAFVNNHIDALLAKLKVRRLDLVMLPVAADPTNLVALQDEKKNGRVRYIGVQTISASFQADRLTDIMRNQPIDFIGVDYDITNRKVEESILPLAQQRKIGVMAFFPFGNAGGLSCTGGTSLFSRVANTPVPEWAAEFDAKSWAQFFAKFVLGHPAITVARVGTTKVTHMIDNLGGGIGRVPDEATRKRMAAFVDALPPAAPPAPNASPAPQVATLSAAILDRYVGEYRTAAGTVITFRRYGTTLVATPGNNPETVVLARSETRFSMGPTVIEFQLDSAGKATSVIVEQGNQKIPAPRVR